MRRRVTKKDRIKWLLQNKDKWAGFPFEGVLTKRTKRFVGEVLKEMHKAELYRSLTNPADISAVRFNKLVQEAKMIDRNKAEKALYLDS